MDNHWQYHHLSNTTRRHFIKGLGAIALSSLFGCNIDSSKNNIFDQDNPLIPKPSHFRPKTKRIIFLHMAGAPSQLELFDYKPELHKLNGKACPDSFVKGKKFAFIQGIPKMLGPQATFSQHGESGAYISERLPYISKVADEITFLKAMHSDEFNHAPAQLLMQTGSSRLGRPSIGSWVTYGLGTDNQDLPGYIVLASGGKIPSAGKSIWGSGFLPTVYQGVQCRSKGDPILYVSDPEGVSREMRKLSINTINEINRQHYQEMQDPEIMTRISQYELAFRMQTSVPELMDISREPEYIHQLYGTRPGASSFANNCLLARRLAEKGVRFIQLYHWGWDSHGTDTSTGLRTGFIDKCNEIDQPMTALLLDLKQRGMLDDTLVVWGGEFGRTSFSQGRLTKENYGRDHHPGCFSMWMAGAGVKGGLTYGETDEFSYNVAKDPVHVHDFQATLMHLMGIDHERLTYKYQGRRFRLTDVHGKVVKDLLA